jgi:hypothetical protein
VRSELHDHPAGDACGPVDQDRLPGLNVERLGHHLVSRQCGNGECCCLCPRGAVGLLGDQACGGDQSIGPAALVAQRQGMGHHAGADGRPLDPRADVDDHTSRLNPERHRRSAPHIPTAGTNELFPVPHPRGPHLDQNLAGLKSRRLGQLEKLHLFPERLDARGSHAYAEIILGSKVPATVSYDAERTRDNACP